MKDSHHHSNGHLHDHGHSHHNEVTEGNKKGLTIALFITLGIMVVEFAGGLFTNSLALLSDSGHMLSDTAALALSLLAFWFASKPASAKRTYGFHRFEILAALFNGIALFLIAGTIIWEAYLRFFEPPAVSSGIMMLIAVIGLAANLASAWSLMRKGDVNKNVNLKSAYTHIIGDVLGSLGAIIAGLFMFIFKWYMADPIISVFVSVLILKSAWGIIASTVHILMEGTPSSVNHKEIKEALEKIDGVIEVHDLHIWTITSGLDSLSCHLLINDSKDCFKILQEAIHMVEHHYEIHHPTIQIENSTIYHKECGYSLGSLRKRIVR